MNIKNYFWLTPFISFIFGYCMMQRLFHNPKNITPNVVGKQVHEILPLITQYNLNIRLIDHKEEADLPEGIILNQTPAAGTAIKANQPLYVVITKKPLTTRAPHCVGLPIDRLTEVMKSTNINPRIYYIPHSYPENMCFAQLPQPNEPLEKNKLILYVSSGNNKPIVWPDFTDIPLSHVIEFLNNYDIEPQIIHNVAHTNYNNVEYRVKEQRPLARTLLTLDKNKPLSVQLRVH